MSRASVHRPGFSSNPDGLALRLGRKAKVFQAVCSSPENAGRELPLHVAGPLSSLNRERIAPGATPENVITVPTRTQDSILTEAGSRRGFDFLSIDVEGHEIKVLPGFDVGRRRPRLIEDHVADLSRRRYLAATGYRIIRRYENNRWYASRDSTVGPMVGSVGYLAQVLSGFAVPGPAKLVAPHSQADRFVIFAHRGTDKYQNLYFAAVSRLT